MLCVRKLTFVDRSEPAALWRRDLKKQWYCDDLVAVRVHDSNQKVLGSTIPSCFSVPSEASQSTVCVSWVDEDPVEEPVAPDSAALEAPENTPQPADEGDQPAPATSSQAPESADAAEGNPADTSADAADTEGPANGAATPLNPPPVESPDAPSDDAPLANSGATASATLPPSEAANPAAVLADDAAPPTSPQAPLTVSSDSGAGAGEENGGVDGECPTSEAARKRSFSSCMPIGVAHAPKGVLHFEIITMFGTRVAACEANVQSILKADSSESPIVQHYGVLITPANAKADGANTIHAVLEFSVVVGTTDVASVVSLAAGAAYSPIATQLRHGNTCAFSTNTFYFPDRFLSGDSVYIVSNVLCVESLSDNPVRLEIALPEDLKRMHVLPAKKAVLNGRGKRAYFACTWDVFSPYVASAAGADDDAGRTSAGFHVLIRDGTENRAPVDIGLVGGPPQTDAECVSPYMFFVNHARVTNNSCSVAEDAILMDILPISLVTRAGA
ncbi:hypothetical protein NESM_000401200 [Novymonas esmeraldas]|uniref:Uncharacterized protein n=1 Tax=Novymonas esmeraldas TaxID=1808958 RepID=A0AAW0EPL8_9TRYP